MRRFPLIEDIIPFHRPYPLSDNEIIEITDKIHGCIKSGQLTNGVYVRELEEKIREMYNVKHCIATSSATQGLLACIYYFKWDKIDIPSFEWKSLMEIVNTLELDVYWVDIDKETWLQEKGEGYYSIGLHTFGNINNDNHTIYDGSHALGCKLPNIGVATVFSLAATKIVTSCEGGLVITDNDEFAEVVREYRDRCARMSEVHAIIGLQTLNYLEEVMEWKSKVRKYYEKHINGQFQTIPIESNHNTIAFLNVNDLTIPSHITTKQYYEPLKVGLPNTDYVYSKIIALPSYYNCNYKKIVEDILDANR